MNKEMPDYLNIIEEVKKHFKKRKSTIAKRTAMVSWPGIALFAFWSALGVYEIPEEAFMPIVIFLAIATPMAFIYMLTMAHIFSMEKILWIDSFFDKVPLTDEESYGIAKKIFFPTVMMRISIFFRYYFFQTIILFLFPVFIVGYYGSFEKWWLSILFYFIIFPISVYLWVLFVKIKLRYLWFVFFDNYGQDNFSRTLVYSEVHKLNEINKTESFKKSLMTTLGSDLSHDITRFFVGTSIHAAANKFGKAGKVAGDAAGVYASEIIHHFSSFAKVIANYLLYRVAFTELHEEDQKVNENIYKLKN